MVRAAGRPGPNQGDLDGGDPGCRNRHLGGTSLGPEPSSSEGAHAHLVGLAVRAFEADLDLAASANGSRTVFVRAPVTLDRDADGRSGVGPEGQEEVGPLTLNGWVSPGVDSALQGVLEEESQGVKPRATRRRRKVENHRRLAPGGQPVDDPSLPALASELADDRERACGLPSAVRDDDPHLEAGNQRHDLAGHIQGGASPGARDREKGREKEEDDPSTSWPQRT